MAKKRIPKKVESKVLEFVNILKQDKLPINKVFVFGSFAKGVPHKWSDIDVCVVSPKFKDWFDALEYLWLKRPFDVNLSIEPVGFNPKDFRSPDSALVQEIKQHGIEIKV